MRNGESKGVYKVTPEKDFVLNSAGQSKELCIKKREIQRKLRISVCQVLCSST